MADVEVKIPQSIINLIPRFHEMKDKADKAAERILKRGLQTSFRIRAFRTGRAMRGVEVVSEGTFQKRNIIGRNPVFYVKFLEKGTYKMKARKPMRKGLADVREELIKNYSDYANEFVQES